MDWLLLLLIVDLIVLFGAYSLAISAKLYNAIYQTWYLKKYDQNYLASPNIAIFIPCKGNDQDFEVNMQTFLETPYHKAKLFFIVESHVDAAYPVLKRLVEKRPAAQLIVAGLAAACGQKNHNLLQGLKAAGARDDVYVFFDSYTTITAQQLKELVLPLSDPKVTVAVGFRWNILNKKTLGERLHAFMIALQGALMNCVFIPAVWGGATAIRRADFENLNVQAYWARTVVDDMTLQHLLQKKRKKVVFVPTCVKETLNTLTSLEESIRWFKRQMLYVKFYLRPFWFLSLSLLFYCAANILSFPLLFLYAIVSPGKKIFFLTVVTGIFNVGAMIYGLLLKRPAHDQHTMRAWFFLSPLYLVLTGYACLLGVFTNVIEWKGISYHLDYDGHVKKIIRN